MNYPSFRLSVESIQNAFKVKQPKSNIYIQGQLKLDFHFNESTVQACEKCSYQTPNSQTMCYHIAAKHSATKDKCNVFDYSHAC